MSVIKQISVFNGNSWNTGNIGADASNIDISSAILGSGTNVQSALTTIGNKIGTTAIPSGLGTTITGAINTLNNNSLSFINDADLNDLKERGHHWYYVSGSLSNAPNLAVNGWIEVITNRLDPLCVKQIWHRMGSSPTTFKDEYIRIFGDNTWSSWEKISTQTDMPTNIYSVTSFNLLKCTGTITGSLHAGFNSDKTRMSLQGRIRITNFVRTGGNPGITVTLATQLNKTQNGHLIGFRGQSPVENIIMSTTKGSNVIQLTTTESYSNAVNGTLTLMIPITTIYID